MRLRFYFATLVLLCFVSAKGQEYHVETPGTLKDVVGEGAEQLTHIRVTGTLNSKDIDFLHYLCSLNFPKPESMKDEDYLKLMKEKEGGDRGKLRHLDFEDARMVGDILPYRAFAGSFLEEIKLPKTLKKIGASAFSYNVLLKELIIPESVEEIGKNLLYYCSKVEKVRLPDNLKVLNDLLFACCSQLKEVNIPSKVRELHDGVFIYCTKVPPSVAILPETVEILDGSVYYAIDTIKEVVVPRNVRVLRMAFHGMPGLRKATILTDKLTEIGDFAFSWCSALEEVNIPDKITRIGNHAFFWNLRLRKVKIPSTVTRIEAFAFDSDPLDSIDIPAGVTFIGRNAFWNNRKLQKVYSRPIVPPVTTNGDDDGAEGPYLPFHSSSTETAVLYVPKGSADAYRKSMVFSEFKNIVELESWEWPSSVESPKSQTDDYGVYGSNGVLRIESNGNGNGAPVAVSVCSIGGASYWSGRVTDSVSIPLPKGLYIVRVGKAAHKISL